MHIMEIIVETEERKKRREELFETIITENFPKLMSNTKTEIQGGRRTVGRINTKGLHTGWGKSRFTAVPF